LPSGVEHLQSYQQNRRLTISMVEVAVVLGLCHHTRPDTPIGNPSGPLVLRHQGRIDVAGTQCQELKEALCGPFREVSAVQSPLTTGRAAPGSGAGGRRLR
jgi:hypothetical protein